MRILERLRCGMAQNKLGNSALNCEFDKPFDCFDVVPLKPVKLLSIDTVIDANEDLFRGHQTGTRVSSQERQ